MTVAVVCPGPSAGRFPGRFGYQAVIGVNRAPLILDRVRIDWWVFTDLRVPLSYPIDYRPRYFTTDDVAGKLGLVNPLTYESLSVRFPAKCGWRQFSAMAAIVLACHVGAKRIDLYGADMEGTSDADGHEYDNAQQCRNPERWKSERIVFQRVKDMLAERGCTVNRINGNP